MKIIFNIIIISLSTIACFGQGNCLLYTDGSGERQACELSYKALEHRQGSSESQIIFDQAIRVGPKYPWAYFEKSVPYFKRGLLHEGLQLLNKAVDLNPVEYLWYRAYWYWQYKNYDLCIKDLERSYAISPKDIFFEPGGQKNMILILALSYAKSNRVEKGIKIMKSYFSSLTSQDQIGISDYHTLGILYLRDEQYDMAVEMFTKQITIIEDLISTHYYLGIAYKKCQCTNQLNGNL